MDLLTGAISTLLPSLSTTQKPVIEEEQTTMVLTETTESIVLPTSTVLPDDLEIDNDILTDVTSEMPTKGTDMTTESTSHASPRSLETTVPVQTTSSITTESPSTVATSSEQTAVPQLDTK